MTEDTETKKFYEMIAQNVQKGDPYSIKLKDDPNLYIGVPVLDLTAAEDDYFSFKVLEPKEKKGIMRKAIGDIESLVQL
jgi:hypothetical protein